MKSLWQDVKLPSFPKLHGDIRTDVLIIGGGLAGLLTAYFLQEQGVKYVLAEKRRICSGNTQNTTAKITFQHGLIYDKLIKSAGEDAAHKYLHANKAAAERYKMISADIDCDFEERDHHVYSRNDRGKLERELAALERLGCDASFCEEPELPFRTAGAIRAPHQAQFHPLKFAAGIARGLNIYENTFVRELVGTTAITDGGRITADRVICATHFPMINKHGSYYIKLYQSRSYVLALEHVPAINGMYVDESDKGLSFRSYGSLLLLGGGGGRTGKQNGGWAELRAFAAAHYPEAAEKYFWAAQDCMSLDGVPYIGNYSARTPDFYVASGYNKWGMTGAMVSAMLLSDRILGKSNEFADVFSPSRSVLKPQLLVNGIESTVNLLTPFKKRVCPHLGCALKWNAAEHSWDCPCHGSRFSEDGTLLENPANGNLKS